MTETDGTDLSCRPRRCTLSSVDGQTVGVYIFLSGNELETLGVDTDASDTILYTIDSDSRELDVYSENHEKNNSK